MNKKRWTKLISVVLLCAFMLAAPFAILPNLPRSDLFVAGAKFEGILEMWHIESFEGGVGSRSGWLKKRCIEFEKINKGCFVNVTVLTAEQASAKLKEGAGFDLVSFSPGTGFELLPFLAPFDGDTSSVRPDLLSGARLNGKLYAAPYMTGGYVLAALNKNLTGFENKNLAENIFDYGFEKKIGKKTFQMLSVVCGYAGFNQPALALCLNTSARRTSNLLNEEFTQYEAYEKFLTGNHHTVLLGTQRDVYRLTNRIEQGRLGECVIQPLTGFSDLIQYIAIGASSAKKSVYASKFAQYLLSDKVQLSLTDVKMFSVGSLKLYSDGVMSQLESALANAKTLNAFSDPSLLRTLRGETFKALETGNKNTIKNYLC